jgi:hypothetical protein
MVRNSATIRRRSDSRALVGPAPRGAQASAAGVFAGFARVPVQAPMRDLRGRGGGAARRRAIISSLRAPRAQGITVGFLRAASRTDAIQRLRTSMGNPETTAAIDAA